MNKGEIARQYFLNGYNCAQAVALVFCDELALPPETALRLVSGFGGGMGRLREVCGAFSGAVFVLSALRGYAEPGAKEEKAALYRDVQALAARCASENGSIVCRELLGLRRQKDSPAPAPRTEEYYKSRPCPKVIENTAAILEAFLEETSRSDNL